MLNFFLSASAVAGVAVIWRNWLEDHSSWKTTIARFPLHKALLCGSCFTYWIGLLYTIAASPLSFWTDNLFLQWMALSWLSVLFRFTYVAVQELVHFQVHHLKAASHRTHGSHHPQDPLQ